MGEENERRSFGKFEIWSAFKHGDTEVVMKTYLVSMCRQTIFHDKYVLNEVFSQRFWRGLPEEWNLKKNCVNFGNFSGAFKIIKTDEVSQTML